MLGMIYRSERVGDRPTSGTSRGSSPCLATPRSIPALLHRRHLQRLAQGVDVLDKQYFLSAFSAVRITPGEPRNFAAYLLDKTFE